MKLQARLVESGAKKLAQMFTKLVAEGSSGTPPASTDFELSTFSPSLMADLKPLVAFLRTLPLPSTHPSHPAAPSILSTLKEAQNGYADMRGNWAKKCLEAYGRRVVERAETMEGVPAGRELGKWIENLLEVAEVGLPGWQLVLHLTASFVVGICSTQRALTTAKSCPARHNIRHTPQSYHSPVQRHHVLPIIAHQAITA